MQIGLNQMSLISEFTPDQLDMWLAFEVVRNSGKYNMFDPRAKKATGLSTEEYDFVKHNYSALKKAASEE